MGSADYKGKASELLIENDIKIGQSINIHTNNGKYSGILLPRYELFDDNHVVIKLRNGYNIGINLTKIRSIEKGNSDSQYDVYKFKKDSHNLIQTIGRADSSDQDKAEGTLPKVALISTWWYHRQQD